MKTISILIPTCNEKENITPFVYRIKELFKNELSSYCYEILIIDNYSTDGTRSIIENLCKEDKRVKAIFNVKNFGSIRSGFYGLTKTTGDCVVKIAADFQEPIETIPEMVREWENGYLVVAGVKHKSKEGKLKFWVRSFYYRLIAKYSSVEQIDQFTGFGLYDKQFIDVCRELDDPYPYFRGIVAELGGKRTEVEYVQNERKSGKSKYNFPSLYNYAMLGITTYTRAFLRIATIIGVAMTSLSFIVGIIWLILNGLFGWGGSLGTGAIIFIMLILNGIELFFIGIMGEYVMNINTHVLHRPLVVEETRLNFEKEENISEDTEEDLVVNQS